MKDLDVDKVLAAMESETVGANAVSLFDMLEMANKALTQIEKLMTTAEKMGLKPLLVRGAGKKLGIDAETPIRTDESIFPKTQMHKELFTQLNGLSETELQEMFNANQARDHPANDTD